VDNAPLQDSVPVTVLTGFLGSGKTTLLRRALTAPAFADTAVVINEIGAIAIDHYLVDFVEGSVLELPGGCLCCAVREDLAQTLRSLIERRDTGEIRRFRRIVIETSGLADPAPILFTLATDPSLDQRVTLGRVVTVVDAVAGLATLDRFAEAARQAAIADALVISKTDLAPFGEALAARLAALNPCAGRILGAAAADPASALFSPIRRPIPDLPTLTGEGGSRVAGEEGWGHGAEAVHSHGIAALTIALEGAVNRLDFARALGGLAQARGNDLLRVKGIVCFADRLGADGVGRPAIVQAAQHAMFAPQWLDDWPADGAWDDRRSRLVFVVHDIAAGEILDRFAFASPTLLGPQTPRLHAGETPAFRQHAPHP